MQMKKKQSYKEDSLLDDRIDTIEKMFARSKKDKFMEILLSSVIEYLIETDTAKKDGL